MGGRGNSSRHTKLDQAERYARSADYGAAEKIGKKLSKDHVVTKEGFTSLNHYTNTGHETINKHLRTNSTISDKEKKDIKNISDTIKKNKVNENLVVFRGANKDGIPKEFRSNPEAMIGKVFQDKGFMSTSMYEKGALKGKSVSYEIHVPKGANAMYVKNYSATGKEQEVLIDKGSKIRVTGVKKKGKRIIVEATLTGL